MPKQATTPTPIYMTPTCAQRLRAELKEILYTLRPEMVKTAAWAASNGDRSENADYHYAKKKLRWFDGRIRFLTQRLEAAAIVDPVEQGAIAKGRVLFGCTVTVENEEGEEKVYSIVGADEFDAARGYVSWTSPIGRALLGSKEGDVISFNTPGGKSELEVIQVEYLALD
ncbi:transcription elongation factor GreB [Geopsychrobacter electrodiphilus]|uniref:transcription elongation factor GreB n=1 Tax=Geopsychrobacter electrodiphilus TaxID=225196 RepID=UPI00036191C4|nr:transcription elongation factor GreB [Geopsychrobacter electrodiphilus]